MNKKTQKIGRTYAQILAQNDQKNKKKQGLSYAHFLSTKGEQKTQKIGRSYAQILAQNDPRKKG